MTLYRFHLSDSRGITFACKQGDAMRWAHWFAACLGLRVEAIEPIRPLTQQLTLTMKEAA